MIQSLTEMSRDSRSNPFKSEEKYATEVPVPSPKLVYDGTLIPQNAHPPIENDEEEDNESVLVLKRREGKEKVIADTTAKVVKSYATRGFEKKLLGDAMKVNESAINQKSRLRHDIVVECDDIPPETLIEVGEKGMTVQWNKMI